MDLQTRLKEVGITKHTPAHEDFLRFQAMIYTVLQSRGYYLQKVDFEDISREEKVRLFNLVHPMWESLREFETK
jgi:hypothetical protein